MTEQQTRRDDDRVGQLAADFARVFGHAPADVICAPGRVNLLGEHTDYNDLPVLPIAIDRCVRIAVAPRRDRTVELRNTARPFARRRYQLSDAIPPYATGDWGNYSKAAAQGLVRYSGAELQRGATMLVDGDIPSAAGLSSSSALVVANALALLAANAVEVPHLALAELLPVAERYVGTLSGGMDQATCLLARAGHALRIDFSPLRVRTVPLPAGYSIVVCHSLVRAEKSAQARTAYNLRVVECRLACRVLGRVLGSSLPRPLQALGDLVPLFPGRSLLDFVAPLATELPDRPLTLAEIGTIIGSDPERLREDCADASATHFWLLRRARHVLSEADRVNRAEDTLRAGDAAEFGRLMDASHASCRDDYDISCSELEELIRLAKEAGAIGARLTGAGFGGCTVNLLPEAEVPSFLMRIDRYFYGSRPRRSDRISDCRFVLRASGCATVVHL